MSELQMNNRQILCNLLPAHVAVHFIDHQNNTHMVGRLYTFKSNVEYSCRLTLTALIIPVFFWYNILIFDVCITSIDVIFYYFIILRVFTSTLADRFQPDSEWQQVSSSLHDSS